MTMPPALRKAVLTTHVATSVGWLGSVVAYLALDVAAAAVTDSETIRAAYISMEVLTMYVIVPLAIASVVIGMLNALGTSWGLLRYYWVLAKLILTLVATTILLLETRTVVYLAGAATSAADPGHLPSTLPHSIGGLLVLLIILILSVFKPQGMTRYGWRKQNDRSRSNRVTHTATSG